jgi:hypothetical protein
VGELQHERRGKGAIGRHEVAQLRKDIRIRQRRLRQAAEHTNVAVLEHKPAHDRDAAEDQEIVDLRHQSGAFGERDEVARVQYLTGLAAQPRRRLVVADLAVRQRDDRLEIEIEAIGLDGAADCGQRLVGRAGSGSPTLPRGIGERRALVGCRCHGDKRLGGKRA